MSKRLDKSTVDVLDKVRASATPQPIESLDELLDNIFAYGIDWTEFKDKSEHDHEVSTFAGKIKDDLKAQLKQHITTLITEREREAYKKGMLHQPPVVNAEVRAKIQALDKLIIGAGEYHDDPYEYVVPLRHIKEYRQELMQLDLDHPIFKDASLSTQEGEEDE